MHVIVVGCGRVGSGLAQELDAAGHAVAVIDRNPEAFRRLPDGFGGATHAGVGFDREVLRRAGAEGADAVVAVTNGDNSNVVVARVAREAFDIDRVVARIYDPSRARIYQRLGIATVATTRWTVDQVLQRIDPSDRSTEWSDASGAVSLTSFPVPPHLAGDEVRHVDFGPHTRLVAVSREGVGRLCTDELVLQDGDVLHLLGETEHLAEQRRRISQPEGGER